MVSHNEAEPRLGIAYNIKRTNTVLRVSYARVLETPFNENLIISSTVPHICLAGRLILDLPASQMWAFLLTSQLLYFGRAQLQLCRKERA